jgi:hypothetical protein
VKNQNERSGLTTEQMMPFVTRVLENPNNWTIQSFALLLKSRLEVEHHRKTERGTLQIQVSRYDI